jgi:DNA replication initiation complex subunit (GINS family)
MFDTVDRQADDLLRLQEKERREHELLWKRQEALYRTLRKTSADMRSEIDRIIAGP